MSPILTNSVVFSSSYPELRTAFVGMARSYVGPSEADEYADEALFRLFQHSNKIVAEDGDL